MSPGPLNEVKAEHVIHIAGGDDVEPIKMAPNPKRSTKSKWRSTTGRTSLTGHGANGAWKAGDDEVIIAPSLALPCLS